MLADGAANCNPFTRTELEVNVALNIKEKLKKLADWNAPQRHQ